MDDPSGVERSLRQAQQVLNVQGRPDVYDWALLAVIAAEADLAVGKLAAADAERLRPLLDEVMTDLRDRTANFRDPEFLRATRADRRRNPTLFRPE